MNKHSNYDSKSSILSIDYKIPYDLSESSKIVQHLQQSQQQLQFLKMKLTQAYEKLEKQIKYSMQLSDTNDKLIAQLKDAQHNLQSQVKQNKKLKQVMETMLKNRKIVEQQVQYTHKRYKKIIQQKQQEYQNKIEELQKSFKKLKRQNQTLEDSLQQYQKQKSRKQSMSSSKMSKTTGDKQKRLQQKIQVLEQEIKKLTNQKVTEVSRLKHEIQCYQKSTINPIRTSNIQYKPLTTRVTHPIHVEYFDAQQNNQNINTNNMHSSTIVQSKMTMDSKVEDDSISKWQKVKTSNTQLTDDQRLTRAQMEKKKIQNQLMKIQRLKRHAPEDREVMAQLQKKIYQLDSQISGLKRKIRQKY